MPCYLGLTAQGSKLQLNAQACATLLLDFLILSSRLSFVIIGQHDTTEINSPVLFLICETHEVCQNLDLKNVQKSDFSKPRFLKSYLRVLTFFVILSKKSLLPLRDEIPKTIFYLRLPLKTR